MTLTFGSLFAGAGGMDAGLEAAGLRCLWQVEIDRTARSVLARHWPGVPRFPDVVAMSRLPGWHRRCGCPDVIVGGFPCQDLSVAGKRKGLAGGRSGLWWHMLRVVNGLRPRFVVFENVPGLLTSDGGRDFRRIVSALAERGYFGAWRVLDAQHFGVPQRRRRVFGVFATAVVGAGNACRLAGPTPREDGVRLAGLCAEVLALRGVPGRHPAAGREAGAEVAGTLGSGPPGSGWRCDLDRSGAFVVNALKATSGKSGVSVDEATGGHVLAYGGNDTSGPRRVAAGLNAKGGTGRQDFETETFVVGGPAAFDSQNYRLVPGGVCNTVLASGGEAGNRGAMVFNPQAAGNQTTLGLTAGAAGSLGTAQKPGVLYYSHDYNQDRVYAPSGLGPALTAADGNRTRNFQTDEQTVRRLTPVECERLMGWPDDWTAIRADGKRIKDGPRYRMCGNGVVGPIAEWIGRRLVEAAGRAGG